jgi:phytoene dehydrogenase-like protein
MLNANASADVVIIGAGLSGLSAALWCQQAGRSVCVLDAADAVGGRVRTDVVDGFLLDRGYQVFLDTYPEAQLLARQGWLDYAALDLKAYYHGALIHGGGDFHLAPDPWRHPLDLWSAAFSPIGSWRDKWQLARWRYQATRQFANLDLTLPALGPETTTRDYLAQLGFSNQIIDRFFTSFFKGVFLEDRLETSSRFFAFIFAQFAQGNATLPKGGMQAIPNQLASRLAPGTVQLNTPVVSVEPKSVRLANGQSIGASQGVIVACQASAAQKLLPGLPENTWPKATNGNVTLYYATPHAPTRKRLLILSADNDGPIAHVSFPSNVQPSYAPKGQHLAAVSVLQNPYPSPEALALAVRHQLGHWLGEQTMGWRLLKTLSIPESLPRFTPQDYPMVHRSPQVADGLYLAGDYCHSPSINGAMASGRLAAQALLGHPLGSFIGSPG